MLYFTINCNVVDPKMLCAAIESSGPNITATFDQLGRSYQFHVSSTENKALVAEAVIFRLAEQLNRVSEALKDATTKGP